MKKVFLGVMTIVSLQAGIVGEVVERLPSLFRHEAVSHGDDLLRSTAKGFERRYGTAALEKAVTLKKLYGEEGLKLMLRYGDEGVLASREAFELVSRYGDRGYYLLRRFPSAPRHYRNYGSRYVEATERFGAERITRWLDEAAPAGVGEKVLNLVDRYGEKAIRFYERNWGKLLVTGFVGLNASQILQAGIDVGKSAVHEAGQAAASISGKLFQAFFHSRLVDYLGIALFGWLGWIVWRRRRLELGSSQEQKYQERKDHIDHDCQYTLVESSKSNQGEMK
jgi:hypothetical protein